jgi:short-subunit dehydrogenase involved in D-alanine esterification of teichoic acids
MKLEKRTVLITGGTGGIGLELAKQFHQLEISAGLSNVMKLTGRIAPNWLLRRMIDPTVARMLSQNPD